MRFSISTCLLLLTLICPAQRVSIKIPVLAFIDEFSFPAIQGGIEFAITKKISWYNEAGIQYRKSPYMTTDTSFVDSRGFKLRSEIRYYKTTVLNGIYFGFNGFYTNDFHNNSAFYYFLRDSSDGRVDDFSVKKTVSGLNLVVGKSYPTRKKITMEIYGGLGVRFISIIQSNTEFDHPRDSVPWSSGCFTIAEVAYKKDIEGGKFALPNFTFGVRVSYHFRRPNIQKIFPWHRNQNGGHID